MRSGDMCLNCESSLICVLDALGVPFQCTRCYRGEAAANGSVIGVKTGLAREYTHTLVMVHERCPRTVVAGPAFRCRSCLFTREVVQ